MSDTSAFGSLPVSISSPLTMQTIPALSKSAAGNENKKIEKSAKDFESILLGSWLQQAEQSFGSVPGGDGEDGDEDSGKDQFQGLAMQSLGAAMTNAGGIGIAKMIAKQLHKADDTQQAQKAQAHQSSNQ